MTIESAAVRVARGVALLDEKRPGWWEKIKVNEFMIQHPCNCVIGFVEGHYSRRTDISACVRGASAAIYGFDSYSNEQLQHLTQTDAGFYRVSDYAALQVEWLRVIAERRAQAEAPPVVWTHRERETVR